MNTYGPHKLDSMGFKQQLKLKPRWHEVGGVGSKEVWIWEELEEKIEGKYDQNTLCKVLREFIKDIVWEEYFGEKLL